MASESKEGVEEVLAKYNSLRKKHRDDHPAIEEGMREYYASLTLMIQVNHTSTIAVQTKQVCIFRQTSPVLTTGAKVDQDTIFCIRKPRSL